MNPIVKGGMGGAITIIVYLGVVAITTPALEPLAAINAALQTNSIIIIGMGVGIGIQMYLSEFSKKRGCNLNNKHRIFGGNTGSAGATSFFSFFSLVPLGCCGWWLYILSLLPGIIGAGTTGFLIEYSQPMAYGGLLIIYGVIGITIVKLKKQQKSEWQNIKQ